VKHFDNTASQITFAPRASLIAEEHKEEVLNEFAQCDSHYVIEDKEDSEAISSDGEFNEANKIDVLSEDDSQVSRIEAQILSKSILPLHPR